MQISSTLIAAQQAAREAQARFQTAHAGQAVKSSFADALGNKDGFAPLPLKQTAAPQAGASQAAPGAAQASRPGSLLDIKI